MTKHQASKLSLGNFVTWQEEMQFTSATAIAASTGEVIEKGFAGFKVKWGDGLVAAYRNDSAANIHLLS